MQSTSTIGDSDFMSKATVFREVLRKAKSIIALTGAGTSAESGVPTFRGDGGLWRTHKATDLATPQAFRRDPILVWQFYHYRRELVLTKTPNPAHEALAKFEKDCREKLNKEFTLITQNVDGLHQRAGSVNILELHGNLYKVRCTKCDTVSGNHDSPICEGLAASETSSVKELPHCGQCGGLLRPHIVWFGENLEEDVLRKTGQALDRCDCCLLVGTSSVVYPAAMFAPELARRGVPVAEFNLETTPETASFPFVFKGPAGQTLPAILDDIESVTP